MNPFQRRNDVHAVGFVSKMERILGGMNTELSGYLHRCVSRLLTDKLR